MKINVDRIPEEGLELLEKIAPHKISLEKDMRCIAFTDSIDVTACVKKSGKIVFINISLGAPAEYTCARCLAKFQRNIKKEFDVTYEVNPGDVLEIDEDIRQEIILDDTVKILCRDDCKGLCPNCGQNLNVSGCECGKF